MPLEKLTGQEMSVFCDALFSAFPERDRLVVLVRTRLDAKLDEITGANKSLKDVVFDLVEWAEAQGRLRDLLESALAENKTNDFLRRLEALLLSSAGTPASLPTRVEIGPPPGLRAGLEKFRSVSLEGLTNWQRRLRLCAQAICRIEKENTITTGFLVGPDIVMTCFWAIQDLIPPVSKEAASNTPIPPFTSQNVVLRFGQVASSGSTPQAKPLSASSTQQGQTYALTESPLIDSDPVRNYALLRVKGMPGMDRGLGGEARRWLRPTVGYRFRSGEPLLILSYPPGENVVLTYGTQERLRRNGWQVDYTAQTPFGSAGCPCFSEDLQMIAMHLGKRSEQEKTERLSNTKTACGKTEVSIRKYGVAMPPLLRREGFLGALLEDLPLF